jgi:hypothetical protein
VGIFTASFTPTPFRDTFFGYENLGDILRDDVPPIHRINSKQVPSGLISHLTFVEATSTAAATLRIQRILSSSDHFSFPDWLYFNFGTYHRICITGYISFPDLILILTKWLSTLSLFLLPSQLPLAKSKLGMTISDFVPDLVLQGIVTDRKVSIKCRCALTVKIKDEMVIKSMSPTTVVDLHKHIVLQTPPYHEYKVIRRDYQDVWNFLHLPLAIRTITGVKTRSLNEDSLTP